MPNHEKSVISKVGSKRRKVVSEPEKSEILKNPLHSQLLPTTSIIVKKNINIYLHNLTCRRYCSHWSAKIGMYMYNLQTLRTSRLTLLWYGAWTILPIMQIRTDTSHLIWMLWRSIVHHSSSGLYFQTTYNEDCVVQYSVSRMAFPKPSAFIELPSASVNLPENDPVSEKICLLRSIHGM